jgi:AcrR family transcriptional regulator
MTPSDKQASGRRRAERRRDIITAALRCFTRHGYNNTTMDDIVDESGLSKGTLYWYFEGKEDLFEASLLSVFEGFEENVLATMSRCETATEKLRCLGEGAAAFGESVGGYFGLFLEYWVSRPQRAEANTVWLDLLEEYKAVLTGIIDEGVEAGEFRAVGAERLVWALMATYDGLAAYGAFIADLDLSEIGRTFTDVMLQGLTRPVSGASSAEPRAESDYTKEELAAVEHVDGNGASRER